MPARGRTACVPEESLDVTVRGAPFAFSVGRDPRRARVPVETRSLANASRAARAADVVESVRDKGRARRGVPLPWAALSRRRNERVVPNTGNSFEPRRGRQSKRAPRCLPGACNISFARRRCRPHGMARKRGRSRVDRPKHYRAPGPSREATHQVSRSKKVDRRNPYPLPPHTLLRREVTGFADGHDGSPLLCQRRVRKRLSTRVTAAASSRACERSSLSSRI